VVKSQMNDDAQKTTSLNILVVDDDANIRRTLSYCPAAVGHTVVTVGNPADAIEEAKRHSFNMAFVGLRLGERERLTSRVETLACDGLSRR
jgi:two-component system, NtrC family, response regulator AlgB